MEREKFKRTFERFEKAFGKFKEVIEGRSLFDFLSKELIVEIATKRFEYTFESMWKALKEYFRLEGIDCSTPLKCFKEAFKDGIVSEENEEIILEMIEKRNEIVHIYDEKKAEEIFEFIKKKEVMDVIREIYEKLKERL